MTGVILDRATHANNKTYLDAQGTQRLPVGYTSHSQRQSISHIIDTGRAEK